MPGAAAARSTRAGARGILELGAEDERTALEQARLVPAHDPEMLERVVQRGQARAEPEDARPGGDADAQGVERGDDRQRPPSRASSRPRIALEGHPDRDSRGSSVTVRGSERGERPT